MFSNFKDIINRFINLCAIEYSENAWTLAGFKALLADGKVIDIL